LLKRTCATPFNFLQRPEPYLRRKRASSRIFLPTAITSISLISPMISKFISDLFNQGPPRDSRKPSNVTYRRLAHTTDDKDFSRRVRSKRMLDAGLSFRFDHRSHTLKNIKLTRYEQKAISISDI